MGVCSVRMGAAALEGKFGTTRVFSTRPSWIDTLNYDLQCYGLADNYKEDLVGIMLLNEWVEKLLLLLHSACCSQYR